MRGARLCNLERPRASPGPRADARAAAPQVFEGGALFDPKVLDIKDEDLMKSVSAAIANVAAASLELGHPTLASIPHMIVHGYKNVLAVAVATEYDFPLAEKARPGRRAPPCAPIA